MDFMSDGLTDGRKVRLYNIVDACNREVHRGEVGHQYLAKAVLD